MRNNQQSWQFKMLLSLMWIAIVFDAALPNRTRRLPLNRHHFNCAGKLRTRHFPLPRIGDNGFRIKIEGDPQFYEPLQEYTVTLQSTSPASFRGFALRSTTPNGQPAGTFKPINSYTTKVMSSCSNVATHAIGGKKTRVRMRWTAPASGCVRFSASVIQKGIVWFKNDGRLSLVLCERSNTSSPQNTTSCCSCGTARYRMTFYGLWSPATHPKDYPAFSTHWSNIIGASHSKDYVIWEYGGYSSEGVQKVAEWGWPADLENEIRAQPSDDVMSVIKTRAQWPAYQPRNLREPPADEFTVDSTRHFVSLLTMLGPSPDWNVGLSRESMCTGTCGWAGTRTYNLTPWDAGTDSGVTYMSPNSPTVPHETIKLITSSDHPESPFFNADGGAIPPLARVVIQRLGIEGEQCGESEAIDEVRETATSSSIVQSSLSAECLYSQWSDWSECAVTCGWGIKTRRRTILSNSTSCDATMEKEICKGTGTCLNHTDATVCLYSEWTSWSRCAATCGGSVRSRSRVLKWPSEAENCHEPLEDMNSCNLPPCACAYSPWSEWMSCSVTCGAGQTLRKRSLEPTNRNCTEPLMQVSKCMTSLTCISDPINTPGCVYTPWSDWSPCPVTCGVGNTIRKRTLRSASVTSCNNFYMETSKCMTSATCDVTCEYGDWSEWMTCSVTCGAGSTLRKRFLTGASSSDSCENVIMETASCHNQPCITPVAQECVFQPWSGWMPCSATCGKGETLRKRFLNRTNSSGNCEEFQMELNICMVNCEIMSTLTACTYSDWSAWMPCDQSCRTFRKKLLQVSRSPLTCDPFVMETKRCSTSSCRASSSNSSQTACDASSWQSWSSCSVTCGRRGHMTRRRRLLTLLSNSTSSCVTPSLRERRRCHNMPRCVRKCRMTNWSAWTSCEDACKTPRRRFQTRQRRIISRLRTGHAGVPCNLRRQKKPCRCT